MEAANQQKILGYFIEEAKEHLETLEKGILDLSSVASDSDKVNEMFRAAHSLKGGAAMLGYGSIQKTAHRLEDAFKILKERQITVDQRLVSLFLAGYDTLRELLEKLQSPFGLEPGEANKIMEQGEPIFIDLQGHLQQLLGTEAKEVLESTSKVSQPSSQLEILGEQARQLLRQMLDSFQQSDTPESRQQLGEICKQLSQLAPENVGWQRLVQTVRSAITNPRHSYQTLAPIAIQELKQGSDCLELDRSELIDVSQSLQQLAAAQFPQLLVPLEPFALAKSLRQVLNQQQLSQLVQHLS